MPFAFQDSFSGYSFSFSLKYNTTRQTDGTDNPILNQPFVVYTNTTLSLPFGNQFVLQPYGNSKAAYDTNNKTSSGDSAITAQGLSKLFASAFTPCSYTFNYDDTSKNTTITLNYDYGCVNSPNQIPPVVFTFKDLTTTRSTDGIVFFPFWSTDQITGDTSGDTSGYTCYPQVAGLQMYLEMDQLQNELFKYLLSGSGKIDKKISGFLNKNPGVVGYLDDSFPVLYFRVQLSDLATFPNNEKVRPFLISSTNPTGNQLQVFSGSLSGNPNPNEQDPPRISFDDLSARLSSVTTDTNTIGLLVFPNLQYNSTNKNVRTRALQLATVGSFPTAAGNQAITDDIRILRNGDVVFIVADDGQNLGSPGPYMSFQNVNNKAPSMSETPNPATNFLWQVVGLKDNGTFNGNAGDKIANGAMVGFYTYNCEGTSPQVCGWLSTTKNPTTGGTKTLPTITGVNQQCEVWTVAKLDEPTVAYIYVGEVTTIAASNTVPEACQSQKGKLDNRGADSPQVEEINVSTRWTFVRKFSSQPLPS